MVVFTCQHCGDSLKKPKVEKHYQTRCRLNTPSLTCVDCLKDFIGNEFSNHTQCVSEAQRYAATGTVIKEAAGKKKQAKYTEIIQNLLDSSDLEDIQRRLLEVCAGFDNVPRKRPKFTNFMTNIAKHVKHTSKDLESVFQLIENAWKKETELKTDEGGSPGKDGTAKKETSVKENGNDDDEQLNKPENGFVEKSASKKSKKNKHNNTNSLNVEENMEVENDVAAEGTKENLNGISKKKLKKQKKYEKYLMELENLAKTENNDKMECEENNEDGLEENCSDGNINKKKSKKSKTLGNGNAMEVEDPTGEMKPKKSKKRKLDDPSNEIAEKKKKDTSAEGEEPQAGFDWTDIIMRVLQSRPDKELSLKRLGKKVIDEYQTVKSDHRTYEELLVKFNKKVRKTKGIRVLKDKAKLIIE